MEKVFIDCLNLNIEKQYFYKKDKIEKEKYLLILPCNGGASKGNYFLGSNRWNHWRSADYYLRNFRTDFFMAACSSVNFHFNDLDGALVFENEMHRVKSKNDFGKANFNIYDKKKMDVNFHKNMLKIGLKRALNYGFENIFIILDVLFYKFSMYKAIDELNIWDKCCFFDVSSMGYMDIGIKFFPIFFNNNFLKKGIYYSDVFSYKKTHVPKNIIKGYEYFESNFYKKLESSLNYYFIKIRDIDNIFYYPIVFEDLKKSDDEIKIKYGLLKHWLIIDKIIKFDKYLDKSFFTIKSNLNKFIKS